MQRHRVYSYAYFILGNREDAEDATQEAFLRLWDRCKEKDHSRIAPWLMRVTRNLCIDMLRRRKTSATNRVAPEPVDLDALPGNHHGDPERHYQLNETQRALVSAMRHLPETTQSALLLHYYQGFTMQAIGQIIGSKPNTVKVALHRGRKALRKILARNFPERVEGQRYEAAV